jgi:type IV pilus assembly protein PilA
MLHKLRSRAQDEKGFTLIELLVVILIIGILAAIALPAFLGQRAKAQDSAAKSDARNMVSQMETCYTDNDTYVGCPGASPGLSVGSGQGQVEVGTLTANGYVITAHSKSGNNFIITKNTSTGVLTRSCTTGGTGGCLTGGSW